MKYAKPYKTVIKGGERVRVQVPRSEVKQSIMKANRWTEEQYRKQVDIFKNRLRAYEAYNEARGRKVTKQSPVTILYAQAKAKQRHKGSYTPSSEFRKIQSFSAYSITKGRAVAKERGTRASRRQDAAILQSIGDRMGNFLVAHAEDVNKIRDRYGDNPALYEKALGAYAEQVHAKTDEAGNVSEDDGVPIAWGEVAGSPDSVEFDFEAFENTL